MQKNYSDSDIETVWKKGSVASNNDPGVFRKDQCGAWIKRSEYGNRGSKYGWEIDHITPVSSGGGDSLSNLRPLQWENNVATSDGKLKCVPSSLYLLISAGVSISNLTINSLIYSFAKALVPYLFLNSVVINYLNHAIFQL